MHNKRIICMGLSLIMTATALLGCGGSPDCPRRMWENRPQRAQRGLTVRDGHQSGPV